MTLCTTRPCMLALATLFLISCGENDPAPARSEALPMVAPGQVENSTSATNTEPTGASTTTTDGAGTVRLNPPHGEPGHVCEIPVGAPLDGSAGSNSQTIQIDPNASGTQTITAPQAGGPIMQAAPAAGGGSGRVNPPHGEPGHVCEIPVGAPLP